LTAISAGVHDIINWHPWLHLPQWLLADTAEAHYHHSSNYRWSCCSRSSAWLWHGVSTTSVL